MSLKFNPITGNFDLVNPAVAAVTSKSNTFVLTSTDITNKYVVLDTAPTQPLNTRLVVDGGPEQFYGDSFVVTLDNSGKRVSWSGLFLDGVLEASDKIMVIYI